MNGYHDDRVTTDKHVLRCPATSVADVPPAQVVPTRQHRKRQDIRVEYPGRYAKQQIVEQIEEYLQLPSQKQPVLTQVFWSSAQRNGIATYASLPA